MRIISKLVIAGTAAIAVAGSAFAADVAADRAIRSDHVMTVRMPDGTVRNIPYPIDVAPRIIFVPVTAAVPAARPATVAMVSPFAMFDRIAAQMDAQADAMLRQVVAMSAVQSSQHAPVLRVAAADGRPMSGGAVSYSFFSSTTSVGKASCSRSVQITSFDPKQPPQVASQSSGDCSKMADINVRATAAPAPAPKPGATAARYDAPRGKPASKAEPTI
jgi:hypothetical protein